MPETTTGGERDVSYWVDATVFEELADVSEEHANLLKDAILTGDSRLLSAALASALEGTAGTPGAVNHFVTDEDARFDIPRVRAFHSATQALAHTAGNGSETFVIALNSERVDTDAQHDASTNSRLTCVVPGPYVIDGRITFTTPGVNIGLSGGGGAAPYIFGELIKNRGAGSEEILDRAYLAMNALDKVISLHCAGVELAASDFVEIRVTIDGSPAVPTGQTMGNFTMTVAAGSAANPANCSLGMVMSR